MSESTDKEIYDRAKKGCSIIFVNDENEVLLLLRDDDPGIPYPNMWDLPGGGVEADETPEEAIIREIKEEMNIDLEDVALYSVEAFPDRMEYTYYKRMNVDVSEVPLTEGQRLEWFSQEEIIHLRLAFGFKKILDGFWDDCVARLL